MRLWLQRFLSKWHSDHSKPRRVTEYQAAKNARPLTSAVLEVGLKRRDTTDGA